MPMEKQGTVENQLAHTIDQTEYDSRYDRTAKKLLANKQILAQIMKGCVNEYGKIRKVYSIWICTQPSDGFENTLTRYSIKPEQLIGEAQEETENYDLMSVVMICLGKPGTENHKGIQFIQALLEANELAVGKDHQFKGRYEAEKNAVIISLEKDEREW